VFKRVVTRDVRIGLVARAGRKVEVTSVDSPIL
jgi:hypothetical protein